MKNPLMRWFLFWLGLTLIALLLFGIFGPKGRSISIEEVSFQTNQSSELYFKNMRSYFYDMEEHKESDYLMYRLGSRALDSNKLSFVILRNWKMSEAYILLESDIIEKENEEFLIETSSGDTIRLKGPDSESQYIFAAQLYSELSKGLSATIIQNEQRLDFTESELKSLKTSLKDYFKLVGKLR